MADVSCPVMSVSRFGDSGVSAYFEAGGGGSLMHARTGQTVQLVRSGSLFYLRPYQSESSFAMPTARHWINPVRATGPDTKTGGPTSNPQIGTARRAVHGGSLMGEGSLMLATVCLLLAGCWSNVVVGSRGPQIHKGSGRGSRKATGAERSKGVEDQHRG
jgi:hypothetical protein